MQTSQFTLIPVASPVAQTVLFFTIFVLVFLFMLKKRSDFSFFPIATTTEMKGIAMLMIILGHIGYFLVADHRFLFPLSVAMGVGVDLFLFLSGFGLAVSTLKKTASFKEFYFRRFARLYLPLWITMILYVPLDIFILHRQYDVSVLAQIALGFVKQADLYNNYNSPLWFLTLIIFYYLIFPLFFWRKIPELSAVVFFLAGFLVLQWNPPVLADVSHLYQLHTVAFPLGVLFAALITRLPEMSVAVKNWVQSSEKTACFSRLTLLGILTCGALFFSLNSGVFADRYIAHTLSILTAALYLGIFILKKTDWGLFKLIGTYSYELYLLHWPLACRYDVLFHNLPVGVAMVLYLATLLGAGYVLNKVSEKMIAAL